jgi:hypothetical protein
LHALKQFGQAGPAPESGLWRRVVRPTVRHVKLAAARTVGFSPTPLDKSMAKRSALAFSLITAAQWVQCVRLSLVKGRSMA